MCLMVVDCYAIKQGLELSCIKENYSFKLLYKILGKDCCGEVKSVGRSLRFELKTQ